MIVGCEDLKFGNSFLEKPQGDEKSIDSVFSQKRYADQALNQFYKSLPDYMPALGGYHDGAFTLDLYSDLAIRHDCRGRMALSLPPAEQATSLTSSPIRR